MTACTTRSTTWWNLIEAEASLKVVTFESAIRLLRCPYVIC